MGFPSAISLLPILAITTVVFLTLFFITRQQKYWVMLAIAWTLVLVAFLIIVLINKANAPSLCI